MKVSKRQLGSFESTDCPSIVALTIGQLAFSDAGAKNCELDGNLRVTFYGIVANDLDLVFAQAFATTWIYLGSAIAGRSQRDSIQ